MALTINKKDVDRMAINTLLGLFLLHMPTNMQKYLAIDCGTRRHSSSSSSHHSWHGVIPAVVVPGIDADSLGFQEHPDGINLLVCAPAPAFDCGVSGTRPSWHVIAEVDKELQEEEEEQEDWVKVVEWQSLGDELLCPINSFDNHSVGFVSTIYCPPSGWYFLLHSHPVICRILRTE